MKAPKTVIAYLKMAANLQTTNHLRGYDKLSANDQHALGDLAADISNALGELSPELQEICEKAEE